MNPYTIGYPPSVLMGARAGIRDPLFLKWHRYVDYIFLRWQNYLGPFDFYYDAPNVTIRTTDIILSFTDVLLKVYPDGQKDEWSEFGKKTFGGSNIESMFGEKTYLTKKIFLMYSPEIGIIFYELLMKLMLHQLLHSEYL